MLDIAYIARTLDTPDGHVAALMLSIAVAAWLALAYRRMTKSRCRCCFHRALEGTAYCPSCLKAKQ